MAHTAQQIFFQSVKDQLPQYFTGVTVVDFGSKDYNGSLREMFTDSSYTGIDISEGKNVDVVCEAHKFRSNTQYDVVVSGEMLEHDEHWEKSLSNMYSLLRSGGLLVISCAGNGRPEHGTRRTDGHLYGTTQDYYKNLSPENIREVLKEDMFEDSEVIDYNQDTYFYGIKN